MTSSLLSVYQRLPIAFTRGEGIWLWDTEGNKYLDAVSGLGVCALGHAHPEITEAISAQAKRLIHISNSVKILEQEVLAKKLTELAEMEKAFFCNSGAEANEAALKLARLYGHERGIEHPEIIVAEKSFHGRTLATLSASSNRKIQAGFEPLVSGFIRVPYNNISALETIAQRSKNIVAIMLEPIIGNGGIIIPDDHYLKKIKELCNQHRWLLILDEVQTGLGRTGAFYEHHFASIKPDILTSAKALGNGIPIAACMTAGMVSDLFQPGKHGSTFGGNPFACHVSHTVLNILEKHHIPEHAKKIGSYLLQQLQDQLKNQEGIVDIRGKGFMIGIEMDKPCKDLILHGFKNGLFLNVTNEKVIRLLPPLILTQEDADTLIIKLLSTIRQFVETSPT